MTDFPISKGIPIPPGQPRDWGWSSGRRDAERWSDEEIAYLRAHWGEDHFRQIAEHLGRGPQAVRRLGHALGLRSSGKAGYYDFQPRARTENQAIQDARRLYIRVMRAQGFTLQQVGDRLGLTRERIRQMEDGAADYNERKKLRSARVPIPCIEGKKNHRFEGNSCARCGASFEACYPRTVGKASKLGIKP